MEIESCKFCKNEFYKGTLDENGKCDRCRLVYPNLQSPDEIKVEKTAEDKENEGRLMNVIERQVNDMLEEYGLLERCVCGKLFHKRSPAQKYCGTDCKAKPE